MSDNGDRVAPSAGTALAVVDQRQVALLDGDEVLSRDMHGRCTYSGVGMGRRAMSRGRGGRGASCRCAATTV